jgi:hypothetical protein
MDVPTKQMISGNLALICCCVFYLAWWVLAFKPAGPIKGVRTGWLLIPALVAGVVATVLIIRGAVRAPVADRLLPTMPLVLAGVVTYLALAVITRAALGRPVTTELILIVGWAVLASYEVSTLTGSRMLSHGQGIAFLAVVLVAFVVSMVCYTAYYRLGPVPGYVVGMVPLASAGVVMGVLAAVTCSGATR